jgi:BON domain
MRRLFFVAASAAALTYFFDPRQGRRRRAVFRDRTVALLRRSRRKASGRARWASSYAHGLSERAVSLARPEEPPADDVTLARKVETIIFRPPDVPKGSINVDAVNGVVTLRGVADTPEQIRELERKAAEISGVIKVENLLSLHGTVPSSG